jgi:hypothetical protein
LKKGIQISVELKSIIGVFSSELGKLAIPEGSGSSEVLFIVIEILQGLLVFSFTLKGILKLLSSVGFVSEGEVLGFKGNDLVLKFDFPSSSSSQSFLEILDLLLEFNNLVFLFVEESGEVKVSGSTLIIDGGVLDSSSEESIKFVLDQKESSIELISVLALNGESVVAGEVVGSEFEDGVFEGGDLGVVAGAGNDHTVVEI